MVWVVGYVAMLHQSLPEPEATFLLHAQVERRRAAGFIDAELMHRLLYCETRQAVASIRITELCDWFRKAFAKTDWLLHRNAVDLEYAEVSQEIPASPNQISLENSLIRDGGVWYVTFEGIKKPAPVGLKGWRYLAILLDRPHDPVRSLDLEEHPPESLPQHQTDDVRFDSRAIREVRDKIQYHENQMAELSDRIIIGTSAAETEYQGHEDQVKQLKAALHGAVGPGGRPRMNSCGNAAQKAARSNQIRSHRAEEELTRSLGNAGGG